MWISTVLVAEALRPQPLIATVDSTVVLSGIVTSVALVAVQPGGPLTVRAKVAERVETDDVPITEME